MTREGLTRTLDEAEWIWLKAHSERGALILVSTQLDLLEVGDKLADDDVASVEEWLKKGLISKPTIEQMDAWDQDPTKRFLSVIIQPYVLIQDMLIQ